MYDNILVPIDLNEESSWAKALPTAVSLCRDYGAKLHVMTVVPDYGMTIVGQYFPPEAQKNIRDKAWEELKAVTTKYVPDDIELNHIVVKGSIYQQIIEAGARLNVDLIVMASHRPRLSDLLIGPNAAAVVRHSDRSVMVVRNSAAPTDESD